MCKNNECHRQESRSWRVVCCSWKSIKEQQKCWQHNYFMTYRSQNSWNVQILKQGGQRLPKILIKWHMKNELGLMIERISEQKNSIKSDLSSVKFQWVYSKQCFHSRIALFTYCACTSPYFPLPSFLWFFPTFVEDSVEICIHLHNRLQCIYRKAVFQSCFIIIYHRKRPLLSSSAL